jgi:hypothetical protein
MKLLLFDQFIYTSISMEPSKRPLDNTSTVVGEKFNENSSSASTVIHKDSLLKRIFLPSANDRFITTQEERRFVRRLDIILMTYGCISYCIEQIDQSNYLSAHVSGMREDVNMTGWGLTSLLATPLP